MKEVRRFLYLIFITAALSGLVSACESNAVADVPESIQFHDFRNIPGVTEEEIREIESLQREYGSFSYGMTFGTEAFYDENGEVAGYSSLFTDWLSDLIGIRFIPNIYPWNGLREGMAQGIIDFSGELTATEERKQTYLMSQPIAERSMIQVRPVNAEPLSTIAMTRPIRLGFLVNAITADVILGTNLYENTESVFLENSIAAIEPLRNGEIDVYFGESSIVADFDQEPDLVVSEFFPPIYNPVSLSTRNPKFASIVSVVDKALAAGADFSLIRLYNQGQESYRKYNFSLILSEEERDYLRTHDRIEFGAEISNYPISFYNQRMGEFQGIAIDILGEIEKLTGLRFDIANTPTTEWPELLEMLDQGEISMISELLPSEERTHRYVWPETPFMTDHYILISKMSFPNIQMNEIVFTKVGLVKDTAHAYLFKSWFPHHENTVEYETTTLAFDALIAGEVDMVMSSRHQLLILTNYRELPDYKANVIFDYSFGSKYGLPKEEALLASIVDKALKRIDTHSISEQWQERTYDFQAKVAEARLPWLVSSIVLLAVFFLLFVIFQRRRTAELGRLQKDLEIALAEAHHASEAKTNFLANMSHEMRTPLNAILGFTELSLEAQEMDTVPKANLETIYVASQTLLSIINDLLDISKIEAGKFELISEEYNLPALINDTANFNILRKKEKPIDFSLTLDENLPMKLYGDDLRIKQIFNNLLSNAFKYTEKGEVEFKLSSRRIGDNIWLSAVIRDTGVGIRPSDLEKLFSPYNQVDVKANRQKEGTGLGLALSKSMCEMMGGSLSVESEYKKGSTFTVKIPQKAVSDEVIGSRIARKLGSFSYNNEKRKRHMRLAPLLLPDKRVLIVDDVQSNLDVAKGMMKRYGMEIDCVSSGQEAIDLISKGEPRYDAIFMDHMMPGIDGIMATKIIREMADSDYGKHIPIIALTANAVMGIENLFLENGFQAFISKPIELARLDFVIRKYVKGE